MPSPFPGMDPYLEAASLWPGVHTRLITAIGDHLAEQLRPRYFVDLERRVYLLADDDPAQRVIVPDVTVVATARKGHPPAAPATTATSAAVTAPTAVLVTMHTEVEVSEPRLVVRGLPGREVVAVIELLCPTNKVPGSRGREEYLAKRREVLHSHAHLVEVDLLRAGERVPTAHPLPPGEYMAHVSRRRGRPLGYVYTWTVRDPLPVLPVPLRPDDPDAALDLGRAVHDAYARGAYDLAVDYRREADPPLSPDDAAWAAGLLARAGLRGA